ncbi:MAG: metallophosphoesterase family protein [Longicatena sp.]
MKILVMSDTHGELEKTRRILENSEPVNIFIHLGDIGFPLQELSKFHLVCGNHDKDSSLPLELIMDLEERKVLCIHGNRFDDETILEVLSQKNIKSEDLMDFCMSTLYGKIASYAKRKGCDTVFFGHTHHQFSGVVDGVTLVNPGSVCFGTPQSGYAIVEIQHMEMVTRLYHCDEESGLDS